MLTTEAPSRPHYANYWETDDTMNPVIVRLDNYNPKATLQEVVLTTTGEHRQVHIHNLGKPRHAH